MIDLRSFLRWLRARARYAITGTAFVPHIPTRVDEGKLGAEILHFFRLERTSFETALHTYRAFSEQKGYAERLGERKTLSLEEAFIIYVILQTTRPRTIVEIGTDVGRSTRRIIDMKNLLELDSPVICFDVIDRVKHFTPDEAQLILRDVTHTFRQDVLNAFAPGVVFLDARPYYLLKSVISGILDCPSDWILAVHDCSRGLCNPRMTISKEDPDVTSATGIWERHVLAEILGVDDPLSERLNHLQTATHHIRVFSTPHGLAAILAHRLRQRGGRLG